MIVLGLHGGVTLGRHGDPIGGSNETSLRDSSLFFTHLRLNMKKGS